MPMLGAGRLRLQLWNVALFAASLLLLASVCELALAQTLPPARMTPEWTGEYFEKRQGGLFVKVRYSGFKATKQASTLTTDAVITVTDVLKKTSYVFNQPRVDIAAGPRPIFKLPSGKYRISRIEMVDMAGTSRVWTPALGELPHFSLKRLCLSNLGLWTISPKGKNKLDVSVESLPNTYSESGDLAESSVVAVVDGFTGLIQARLGGKKLLAKAKSNYESPREIRATVSITRQIAMFYKLDLFRHNQFAKPVAAALSTYDPNLRACYTSRLDENGALKGDVKFTFLLSKQTGTMARLKHAGGSAQDPKLVECMYKELVHIQFPVRENMIGQLIYSYDVR